MRKSRISYASVNWIIASAASHPDDLVWCDTSLIMANIHPNPTLHPNFTSYGPQITVSVAITTRDHSYIFKKKYTKIWWHWNGRKQWYLENTVPFVVIITATCMSPNYGKHPSECSTSIWILNGLLPAPIFNIVNFDFSNTYKNRQTINCLIVMAMVGLMLSLPEPVRAQAPPAKPFLRHLTAILTASWPEKEIFLLHQFIFLHVCISVVLMPIGSIFAVLLNGDEDNKLNEQDSINEIYLHCERHDLLTTEGCCHRKDAVRYITVSGL